MDSCCNKNCGGCSGCNGCLELTAEEISMLQTLAQFPFLPVARRADSETPIYLEDTAYPQEHYSLILQLLEKKSLISIDYDHPLTGADMSAYKGYPVHGSMALTARGQLVIDKLNIEGIQ